MWIRLVDYYIVLRQKDRRPILDHRKHLQLVRVATIHTPLFLLLDNDVLMQHLLGSLTIQLGRMHQLMFLRRVNVEVFDLCEEDGAKAALVDLVEAEVQQIVDVYVVEHH